MASTAIPKSDISQDIKGVIHADNTSRIQICNDKVLSKVYYPVLKGGGLWTVWVVIGNI